MKRQTVDVQAVLVSSIQRITSGEVIIILWRGDINAAKSKTISKKGEMTNFKLNLYVSASLSSSTRLAILIRSQRLAIAYRLYMPLT